MNSPNRNFYATAEWKALRRQAVIRDRHRCTNCGADVSAFKAARVDHILTVRERPDLALQLSNLRTLCAPCDNSRHSEKGGTVKPEIGLDGFPDSWR